MKTDTELQETYDECVSILEQLHGAIILALSLTEEYDSKSPTELVQFALDNYKEFSKMSPEQIATIEKQTEGLFGQLKDLGLYPEDITEGQKPNKKKELLN